MLTAALPGPPPPAATATPGAPGPGLPPLPTPEQLAAQVWDTEFGLPARYRTVTHTDVLAELAQATPCLESLDHLTELAGQVLAVPGHAARLPSGGPAHQSNHQRYQPTTVAAGVGRSGRHGGVPVPAVAVPDPSAPGPADVPSHQPPPPAPATPGPGKHASRQPPLPGVPEPGQRPARPWPERPYGHVPSAHLPALIAQEEARAAEADQHARARAAEAGHLTVTAGTDAAPAARRDAERRRLLADADHHLARADRARAAHAAGERHLAAQQTLADRIKDRLGTVRSRLLGERADLHFLHGHLTALITAHRARLDLLERAATLHEAAAEGFLAPLRAELDLPRHLSTRQATDAARDRLPARKENDTAAAATAVQRLNRRARDHHAQAGRARARAAALRAEAALRERMPPPRAAAEEETRAAAHRSDHPQPAAGHPPTQHPGSRRSR
ncbi:hypothetical protein SAMN05421773_12747 [Streptomyces aidingensis]|uniref:Uncharacterized protein n=2 Tax=Streptomyces aidingensis TaxID=910347 RepID=A0A1I1UWJ8_9ACTN|nr:hypothetical protein SAMN05421773_12747 [Streptomyces aidingensis]